MSDKKTEKPKDKPAKQPVATEKPKPAKQPVVTENANGTKTYDFSQGGYVNNVVMKKGEVANFKF